MINKHFFKTLTLFLVMIIIGLVGVFVVSYLDSGNEKNTNDISIAK